LPETLPIAENATETLSAWPGATMRGWAILKVSAPVEPAEVEVLVALVALDVDMSDDVVEDEDTIGISM